MLEQPPQDGVFQSVQIGAATHEVPFPAQCREPIAQVDPGVAPDRRVACQSKCLAEQFDGQRLSIGQFRLRAAARNLPIPMIDRTASSTAQYSQIRNISWSMGDLPWWFTTQGIVHFFAPHRPAAEAGQPVSPKNSWFGYQKYPSCFFCSIEAPPSWSIIRPCRSDEREPRIS